MLWSWPRRVRKHSWVPPVDWKSHILILRSLELDTNMEPLLLSCTLCMAFV
jgi:hypothetical protein